MGKVIAYPDLIQVIDDARDKGKTIVSTNGCFDILHVGHVRNLEAAKALGDILVVGVNSDASVRMGKGEERPIVPEAERVEVVAALAAVDYAFVFDERTPFSWIRELRPHIHTKGGGEDILSHPDLAEQREVVEAGGGTFVLTPHHEGRSTTDIIRKIRKEPA